MNDSKAPQLSRTRKILIEAALCTACVLVYMDSVIVSTALPSISKDLHASSVQYAWVGSSYLLASASVLPLSASLSDIFGRKPVMLAGNVVFLLGGLLCALSHKVSMLIAGRVLQGAGGGAMLVLLNVCIADIFSLRERSFYLAIIGATSAVSTSIGPVIGGALTSSIGWQWCFWINLPFGGLTLPCLAILLDLHNPKTPFIAGLRAIDFPGAITITGATIMLLLGLQFGGVSYPWDSAIVICLIVAGGVTFGLFGVLQYVNRSGVRIIPFRVFSRPTNIAALVVCFCHGFVFFGCLYYLSMYLQFSLDQGPIYAGLWLLAAAVPLSCASIATGLITKKTGRYREIISISALVMTLGCGLLIDLPAHQSWPRIVFYEMILAAGLGPLFQGPLVAVQSQVPPEDAATATSACSFLRMIGASISLVAGQVLLSNHLQNKSANLLAAGIPDEVVAKILKKFIALGNDETAMLTTQQQQLVRRTFNDGMHNIWILDTALSALAFLCSLFIQHKALSGDNTIGAPAGTQSTQELARIESSIPSGAQSPALSHYDGNTEQKQEEHNFI